MYEETEMIPMWASVACLQVLQAVIRCDAGVYLTNESVCKAYQAAFMLGNLDAGENNSTAGHSAAAHIAQRT